MSNVSKKTDEEIYEDAKRQEQLSRKLSGPPVLVPERKPEAMSTLEGLLNSRNPIP